jgi:hypothetical protein
VFLDKDFVEIEYDLSVIGSSEPTSPEVERVSVETGLGRR